MTFDFSLAIALPHGETRLGLSLSQQKRLFIIDLPLRGFNNSARHIALSRELLRDHSECSSRSPSKLQELSHKSTPSLLSTLRDEGI